jgi:hypothetical protein
MKRLSMAVDGWNDSIVSFWSGGEKIKEAQRRLRQMQALVEQWCTCAKHCDSNLQGPPGF